VLGIPEGALNVERASIKRQDELIGDWFPCSIVPHPTEERLLVRAGREGFEVNFQNLSELSPQRVRLMLCALLEELAR